MIKRRHFLLGGLGAAGALVIGWAAMPPRQRLLPDQPLPVRPGQFALNGWVKVGLDNTVTIVMSQAEMGQGVHTGVAMLLADEMDAAWEQVRLEQSTLDRIYNNQAAILDSLPFDPDENGVMKRAVRHLAARVLREVPGALGTGGSSSVKDQWLPMREAGAAARAVLIAAAARQWNVSTARCRAEAGRVLHPAGRSATFGELAASAARVPIPKNVKLKEPHQFRLVGQPVRRFESAAKLDGSAVFGIDVLPPGLLYASVRMCPTLGGKVAQLDGTDALSMRGVRKVIALEPPSGGLGSVGGGSGGVAVIADSPFRALRALDHVAVKWDEGAAATVSSHAIAEELSHAAATAEGRAHYERGDVAAALGSVAKRVTAEYRVPFLAHAAMEPLSCTVQFNESRATVWAGTQSPGMARNAVASALGIDTDQVTVHVPFLGGSFGRRNFTDFVSLAAVIAREAHGAPVQTLWPREQDMTHDFYRPAYAARCEGGLDAQGQLIAWRAVSAGSSLGAPSFLDTSVEGLSGTAYAIPNVRIASERIESQVPVGIWRSVQHSQNGFFTESFIDELAASAGRDPVDFRAQLLRGDERHLRVLQRAAELSSWSEPAGPAPDGAKQARGIAIHRCFGSIVAQVAEVSVTAEKQVRVHRVICVIDCGFPVNPNLIRQQMESGIVYGLSAALYGEITVENGQVQQRNFDGYAPLRIADCPAIETDIIPGTAAPGGVGEAATPPIAPAVANAVFALTGQRLRSLPLRLA